MLTPESRLPHYTMVPFPLKVFIVVQCYAVLSAFKHCLKRRSLCGRVCRPSMSEGDGFLDQPARTLSGMLSTNPLFSLASKAYSFFYWFPRNNLPYDKPWILFRNNTIEWLAWYQFPHNLPPYGYLGEGYPQDFFCWGLSGNTLPLGNWDPWGLHQVSKNVVQKYRESELKHGRIAMVACLGFLTQEFFHPLYDGRIQGLAITHMAQLREMHDTGLLQHYLLEPLLNTINVPIPDLAIPLDYWTLLVAVGAVECASLVRRWTRWDRNEYNHQFDHNIGIGNIRQSEQMGGAFYEGLSASDKNFLVNAELNHGRLAMIAIVGMILQEYLTVAKLNVNKTSSRRKMRKAHFGATSVERRTRMSSPLSKELFQRHHVRSLPVRVEDEVRVLRGGFKGKEGKVVQCYRKKYVIHVERCTRDKANGQTIHVGIDASNVEITKIKMDKSRKSILDRKNRVKIGQSKGDAATANIVD